MSTPDDKRELNSGSGKIRNITADSNNVETTAVPLKDRSEYDRDPDLDLDFEFSFASAQEESVTTEAAASVEDTPAADDPTSIEDIVSEDKIAVEDNTRTDEPVSEDETSFMELSPDSDAVSAAEADPVDQLPDAGQAPAAAPKRYGLPTGRTITELDNIAPVPKSYGLGPRRQTLTGRGLPKTELRQAAAKSPDKVNSAKKGRKLAAIFSRRSGEDQLEAGDMAKSNTSKNSGSNKNTQGSKSNKKNSSKSGPAKTAAKSSAAKSSSKPAASSKKGKNGNGQSSGKTAGNGKAAAAASKPKKKRNGFVTFVKAFCITVITVVLIGCIAGGAYTAYIISHADPIHPDRIYDTLDVSSHIYDDKEKLVDEIYYSENRQISTYDELPDDLKNAFIAVEDKTFWTHKGFNFRRIVGAILERFKGGRISGTSTITQQLARNVFLPEDKEVRSLKRKITEMYYAYEIEESLSKEDILTAYLNTIYLGYGCYGVDTAARTYFSSSVEDLTLEQCASLAALPQAPGTYSLLVTEEGDYTTKIKKGLYANDASESRRNMILGLMEDQGYITHEEREEATKPLADFIKPGSSSAAAKSAFKDYLIETIKNDLMKEYDLTEEQAVKIIYTKGLNIYSTMDSQAQNAITKQFKNKENFPSTVKKSKGVEAAMVITEIGTGEIKAMVGSRSASGQMLFNRATNPRQPGSSIKPLSVYAPALQKSYEYRKSGSKFKYVNTGYDKQGTKDWGDYITASSTVIDEPLTVNGKTWPQNVTRSFSGQNTFRTAIQKSINTCAVKILAQVGISYSMEMVQSFGITTAISDTSESHNDYNLAALGLGAMTEGVTPLEMSVAYAVFPNKGVRNTPICYTRVDDANGRTLLEAKSETVKVLDEGVAWIMTDVLRSIVTQGIAGNAAISGTPVGGKTGTTDDRYDIWFDGFTPTYSAALWIGTDDNVAMDRASDAAAALWSKIMSNVKRANKGEYPARPSNVSYFYGEYYTVGTEPPEPEPEEDEEDEDGKDGKDSKDKKDKSGSKEDVKTESKNKDKKD